MKRKLIEFDVFERIKQDSLSTAEKELTESAAYLAKSLNLENLEVNCFGSEDVIFESIDGTFIHANYKIDNGFVEFDNIEQLVINEDSAKAKSREILSKIIDRVVESKDQEANELFAEWLDLPVSKKIFNEVRKRRLIPVRKNGKMTGKYRVGYWQDGSTPKKRQSAALKRKRAIGRIKANKKRPAGAKRMNSLTRKRMSSSLGKSGKVSAGMVKEWHMLAENVIDYVNYCDFGPIVRESFVSQDENNNVVAVKIPTIKMRNEAKMLQFNWKTLNTDVAVKRKQSKSLHENEKFSKDIAEIKKQNALSDEKALEEALQNAATNWSEVLYLTQSELASQVKLALESLNVSNYDDSTCEFIAEGLLRTAHEVFVDKVARILKLAGAKVNENSNDKYAEFKSVVEAYYKNLDESTTLEMQVFVDLYEALRSIYETAKEEQDDEFANETATHLDSLLSIIKQESAPSLDVASEAADWLYDVVETNLEGMEWEVEEPVVSATGDHPMVKQNAKKTYSPASDLSDYDKEVQMTSDGKVSDDAAGELANDGLSNEGGEDVYPNLNNPYILKNGDCKISGEKDIESDSDQLAHAGGEEAWPNLQNPYVKNAEDVFKIKN